MRREDIHELMQMLNVEKITDRSDWVSSTCPFKFWFHDTDSQTRSRNSFGISIGDSSFYHCFSCGKSNHLNYLPTFMSMLTKGDWVNMRKFIYERERLPITNAVSPGRTRNIQLKLISENFMVQNFKDLSTCRNLTPETIQEWFLRFDDNKQRVVIPIRDKMGRIVAVKGRAVGNSNLKYLLYTEKEDKVYNSIDPKKTGIWFGQHVPLVQGKALVLVEGELDCIQVKQLGFVNNVWGVMGVGITKEQLQTLAGVNLPLIFYFDDDKAGHDLKNKIHKKLGGLTRHMHVTNYAGCKDAGEAAEKGKTVQVLKSIANLT